MCELFVSVTFCEMQTPKNIAANSPDGTVHPEIDRNWKTDMLVI